MSLYIYKQLNLSSEFNTIHSCRAAIASKKQCLLKTPQTAKVGLKHQSFSLIFFLKVCADRS